MFQPILIPMEESRIGEFGSHPSLLLLLFEGSRKLLQQATLDDDAVVVNLETILRQR
jgi:hypothetical protein